MIAARGDPDRRRVEARRARKPQTQPGDLITVAIPSLPNIFHIVDFFLLGALLLLFALFNFVRSVADFLHSRVDFLQFYLGRIARRNNLRYGLFHCLPFVDEVFRRVVHLLSLFLPKLIGFFFEPVFAVNEIYAEFHGRFRWHVVFYLKRGNVLRLHVNHLVFIRRGLGAFRQAIGPAPLQGPFAVRLQREFALLAEQLVAQNPIRIEDQVFREVDHVVVFNDTARLNIGEREGLSKVFKTASLDDFLFIDFAVKVDDRAIRPYRAGFDVMNIPLALDDGNFHIGEFPAFFSEYFLADVVVLVGSPNVAVVTIHLPIENNRRRSRRFRLAGHLQLFWRNRQPFIPCAYERRASRGGKDIQQQDEHDQASIAHDSSPNLNRQSCGIRRNALEDPWVTPVRLGRSAVTGRLDGFAVSRILRGSRPMGSVADLSNLCRWTLQGCYPPVNRTRSPGARSPRPDRILFPASPTCGIIPPHRPHWHSIPLNGEDSLSERPWRSTAPPGEFRTYISAEESPKEFTIRAVILGALFGLLFGAVTVYVGLRAGLTVSASIPISVLSISILRAFGRSTILENNIVQTTGSAGESLAAGVMFTIPALIFLGFGSEFTFWRIFPLALLGGWLGVQIKIPLRRQLIVKEHGNLSFPEGTACPDVLVAGERGGSFAGRVFWGLGFGGVYTFLMKTVLAWTEQPEARPTWFPGASFRAAITSEYLGVGYIIGPRVSGILFAGGIVSWLVMMPAIKFYGQLAGNAPIYPSTIPIPLMTPDDIWRSYIRPMGAGAVAAAGLITLLRTMPTIISALRAGLKDVRAEGGGQTTSSSRIDL